MTSIAGPKTRACRSATILLTVDTAVWALHLAVRPPCPDGYVRLVDLGLAVPGLAALGAIVAGALWLSIRPTDSQRLGIEGGVSVVLGIAGVILMLLAVPVLISDGQQSVATNCWTF